MSQPSFESTGDQGGILVPKPKTSIYTVLLIISLVALLIACLFLWLEISEYGGWGAWGGPSAMLREPVEAARTLLYV